MYKYYWSAIGCTNLIPPDDAWIKREDDKIIIGCYTSRQTWQLRCHDGRWTGVVSNCSKSKVFSFLYIYSVNHRFIHACLKCLLFSMCSYKDFLITYTRRVKRSFPNFSETAWKFHIQFTHLFSVVNYIFLLHKMWLTLTSTKLHSFCMTT